MGTIIDYNFNTFGDRIDDNCVNGSIGATERILSVVAGTFIVGFGLKNIVKRPIAAFSGLSLGGALVCRGLTGRCKIKAVVDLADREKREEIEYLERRYIVK